MSPHTTIHFRDGKHTIVDGPAREVANELRSGSGIALVTVEGASVFVNWDNVLYIEQGMDDSASVPDS